MIAEWQKLKHGNINYGISDAQTEMEEAQQY